ncbi:MAG: hypothetical protein MUC34_13295 [Anaerolineae bacterium]|nr:hypothetical protein [Anaerolineae bacterium]
MRRSSADPPFNFLIHTSPFRRPRPGYWSTIQFDYHWHLEIIPRLTRPAGFEEGSGFFINPVSPEEAADVLAQAPLQPKVVELPTGQDQDLAAAA